MSSLIIPRFYFNHGHSNTQTGNVNIKVEGRTYRVVEKDHNGLLDSRFQITELFKLLSGHLLEGFEKLVVSKENNLVNVMITSKTNSTQEIKFHQNDHTVPAFELIQDEIEQLIESLPSRLQNSVYQLASQVSEDERKILQFFKEQIDMTANDIAEILNGAYVELHDDGATYEDWSQKLDNPIQRYSSHKSDGAQYGVRGVFVKECLFSRKQLVDDHGKKQTVSWFQLERYPASLNPLHFLPHFWSYLLYKITGQNQGPYGSSIYREANPLILKLRPQKRAIIDR